MSGKILCIGNMEKLTFAIFSFFSWSLFFVSFTKRNCFRNTSQVLWLQIFKKKRFSVWLQWTEENIMRKYFVLFKIEKVWILISGDLWTRELSQTFLKELMHKKVFGTIYGFPDSIFHDMHNQVRCYLPFSIGGL